MANTANKSHKGGKKNRKWGRNSKRGQSVQYRNEMRRTINKEARRQRTAKRQPNNRQVAIPTAAARRLFDERNRQVNAKRRLEVIRHLILRGTDVAAAVRAA